MSEKSVLLKMEHISKSFGTVRALSDVQFQLNSGEIHALLGENGAGKTTLIKVLTGVEELTEGGIYFNGHEIHPRSPQEAQKTGISTVYQEVNLCPNISVAENLFIGREIIKFGKIDWAATNRKAAELLQRFDLHVDVTMNLDYFSVAVQQMIAIARACDISAKVLILDEPTSCLSSAEVVNLFAIMKKLKDEGMGIIFVTHFLEQVYEVTDKITVLRNGEFVGTYLTESLTRIELVSRMLGKDYTALNEIAGKDEVNTAGDLFLEMDDVSGIGTIRDMNLSIHRGEVMGLSGLLGSGRSETAKIIFGIDRLEKGEIRIRGKKVHIRNALDAICNGIGFCPEDRKVAGIIGDLSIRDNIVLAVQTKYGIFHTISRQKANQIADEYIEKLEIKTSGPDQKIKNLSGGNQQKVILARWLATHPDLLILDEPTRGIDIGTKAEIQKILMKLAARGMAVIFISSEIDEMIRCCTSMAILKDMRKITELRGDEISEQSVMSHIAGGKKA